MPAKLVIGVFRSETVILQAVTKARMEGHSVHDVYTPYPIHGMDEALCLPPDILPRLCFLFGSAGLTFAGMFQWWVSAFDWPMNIGGKSFSASPALIPVAFEFTVLCAGLGTVASLFWLRKMWPGKKSDFPQLGATNDAFLLALVARGGEERRFLQDVGADKVEEVRLSP